MRFAEEPSLPASASTRNGAGADCPPSNVTLPTLKSFGAPSTIIVTVVTGTAAVALMRTFVSSSDQT